MKMIIATTIILILVSVYFAQASTVSINATVQETEINHCAKVLRDAGYLD